VAASAAMPPAAPATLAWARLGRNTPSGTAVVPARFGAATGAGGVSTSCTTIRSPRPGIRSRRTAAG